MKAGSLSALQVLQTGPVIPVLVIEDIEQAVPMAKTLLAGGVRILEVTLRTDCALAAISRIAVEVPDAIVGAGTVINPAQFAAAESAGAKFIISPGITDSLLSYAASSTLPFIPGISSVSELMVGMDAGLREFKFFPAEANGGVKALQAIGGPFASARFCPTGGITPVNAPAWLALPNVVCVGGSWLVTREALKSANYSEIEKRAQEASRLNIS